MIDHQMATPARDRAPGGSAHDVDQRVILHGVRWRDYEAVLSMRGESSVPRIAYLEGELELMTPSFHHEAIKKCIARLVEAWADQMEVTLHGAGSWTLKNARRKRGVEPDECYIVGELHEDRPDFAIEVVWTHGGLDKLTIYAGLGIPEVWVWSKGRIEVLALRGDTYRRRRRSAFLPELDLELLQKFVDPKNQSGAVRAYRAALGRH